MTNKICIKRTHAIEDKNSPAYWKKSKVNAFASETNVPNLVALTLMTTRPIIINEQLNFTIGKLEHIKCAISDMLNHFITSLNLNAQNSDDLNFSGVSCSGAYGTMSKMTIFR